MSHVRGGAMSKRSQGKPSGQVADPGLDAKQAFANPNPSREAVPSNGMPRGVQHYAEDVDVDVPVSSSNQFLKSDEAAEKSCDTSGKVAIPRLPKTSKQGVQNLIILPPPVQQVKHKYKPIKPKPEVDRNEEEDATKWSYLDASLTNGCEKTSKSNESFIGCLEKDALDDYLYEGSNSQEPEEEMMQYFPPQGGQMTTPAQSQEGPVDKISQLRQLLERNLNQNAAGRGFQAPNKHAPYQNGLSAAASLSLLSQRSQQKAALPSLMSHGHAHMTNRRVSFEVPVEPDSASSSVPPSPNTKQGGVFSFTPISPRPYSPVNGRCASKASSANASPFVSPRNTPVPRAKAVGPQQPASYVASPLQIAQSRTFTRSASASCDASPYLLCDPHSRPSCEPNLNSAMSLDVKPDLSDLHVRSVADINGNRAQTCQLSPLHLPRVQFPVSMSAPQSPVVPTSRTSKRARFSFRKEARAQSLEIPMSQQVHLNPLMQNGLRYPEDEMNPGGALSSEVGFFFPEDEASMAAMHGMGSASFRSQSVPLRRMVSSAQAPFSYCNQGPANMLNMYTPSNGSSVTPTPVPSEMADFGVDSDTMLPAGQGAADFGNENADLLLNEGNSAPLNSILKEMICMLDKGDKDAGEAACSQPSSARELHPHPGQSHSYPSTPLPYKAMQESSLGIRGDPLFNSFQLQTGRDGGGPSAFPDQGYDVLLSAGGAAEEEERLSAAAVAVDGSVSVLDGLDDISGRDLQVLQDAGQAPDLTEQENMALLLEESPAPYMTEVFEYNELAPGITE